MTDLEMVRHTLATLAYRAAKALRGAPESFATFLPGPTSNTPVQIVAHMGDLMDWALTIVQGRATWHTSDPQPWLDECARFFASLKRFDDALKQCAGVFSAADTAPFELTRLFQGPIADAFTHTGQIAMLRRLHGSPIKGESYNRADIVIGRVGFEQTPANPKYEFD
ncbi:MAG TPA: hypothetical protein VN285_00030 [Candidatus Deferrimicrobium sp.]|nr:hypothetical protein [Candidatus Deferrimicrobium sp.]